MIDALALFDYGQWPWPRTLVAELVSATLEDPGRARAAAARGRTAVLEHHTFDQRARALLDLVDRYAPPDAPAPRPVPGVR